MSATDESVPRSSTSPAYDREPERCDDMPQRRRMSDEDHPVRDDRPVYDDRPVHEDRPVHDHGAPREDAPRVDHRVDERAVSPRRDDGVDGGVAVDRADARRDTDRRGGEQSRAGGDGAATLIAPDLARDFQGGCPEPRGFSAAIHCGF